MSAHRATAASVAATRPAHRTRERHDDLPRRVRAAASACPLRRRRSARRRRSRAAPRDQLGGDHARAGRSRCRPPRRATPCPIRSRAPGRRTGRPRVEARRDASHAAFTSGAQSIIVGKRLPSTPLLNGSGKDPTTAGIGVGRAPVVQVPPDVVALLYRGRRRALRRLDPVDVVEPVAVAPSRRRAR